MRPRFTLAFLALSVLLHTSCAGPIAPRYEIQKLEFEVHFISPAAGEPYLHVVARYRLRNAGNRALASLRVALPGATLYSRRNVQYSAGSAAPLAVASGNSSDREVVIPLSQPLPQKQRLDLHLEYDLAPPPPGTSAIAVHADAFHVVPGTWLPALLPPGGLLSSGGSPPEKFHLTVFVPADFRVYCSGRHDKTRRSAGGVAHRFRFGPGDFSPSVVAGRYHESRHRFAATDVVFATLEPRADADFHPAAERLALSRLAFQSAFGRVMEKDRPVVFAESPSALVPPPSGPAAGGASSRNPEPSGRGTPHGAPRASFPSRTGFPGGALLNSPVFALGPANDLFLELAERELAHTWFGGVLRPHPDAAFVLTEGLGGYAFVVAAESRGGPAERTRQIARSLAAYDFLVRRYGPGAEKTLESDPAAHTSESRLMADMKSELFFLALEDEFGRDAVRRGIARLVAALRNSPLAQNPTLAGLHDLRAALEAEIPNPPPGPSSPSAVNSVSADFSRPAPAPRTATTASQTHPVADFFRGWLLHTGIPPGFRARYELQP